MSATMSEGAIPLTPEEYQNMLTRKLCLNSTSAECKPLEVPINDVIDYQIDGFEDRDSVDWVGFVLGSILMLYISWKIMRKGYKKNGRLRQRIRRTLRNEYLSGSSSKLILLLILSFVCLLRFLTLSFSFNDEFDYITITLSTPTVPPTITQNLTVSHVLLDLPTLLLIGTYSMLLSFIVTILVQAIEQVLTGQKYQHRNPLIELQSYERQSLSKGYGRFGSAVQYQQIMQMRSMSGSIRAILTWINFVGWAIFTMMSLYYLRHEYRNIYLGKLFTNEKPLQPKVNIDNSNITWLLESSVFDNGILQVETMMPQYQRASNAMSGLLFFFLGLTLTFKVGKIIEVTQHVVMSYHLQTLKLTGQNNSRISDRLLENKLPKLINALTKIFYIMTILDFLVSWDVFGLSQLSPTHWRTMLFYMITEIFPCYYLAMTLSSEKVSLRPKTWRKSAESNSSYRESSSSESSSDYDTSLSKSRSSCDSDLSDLSYGDFNPNLKNLQEPLLNQEQRKYQKLPIRQDFQVLENVPETNNEDEDSIIFGESGYQRYISDESDQERRHYQYLKRQ